MNITVEQFKSQFPRFSPQYLSDINYVVGKTYFKDDIVFYLDQFYICKKQTTVQPPTENADWGLYNDSVLNYTQDLDIEEAINEASINFNKSLFGSCNKATTAFLLLTAHYLTVDFQNALGGTNIGITTSKSVGSVSEGYTIPPYIQNSPVLSAYCTTGYGIKYASLLYPYLIGNVMLFRGGTTIA